MGNQARAGDGFNATGDVVLICAASTCLRTSPRFVSLSSHRRRDDAKVYAMRIMSCAATSKLMSRSYTAAGMEDDHGERPESQRAKTEELVDLRFNQITRRQRLYREAFKISFTMVLKSRGKSRSRSDSHPINS